MKATVSFEFDLSNDDHVTLIKNITDYIAENGGPAELKAASVTNPTKVNVAATKTDIKIEDLRDAVREKSKDKAVRAKIIKKLDELGVKATSELKEEQFEEFKEFLDTL